MAEYFLRADGTAANKAAATGPYTDAAKCMNMLVHNASIFSAGDVIYVSDAGGVFNAVRMIPPSSGTSGSLIAYIAVTGQHPEVYHASAGQQLDVNGKSYLSFYGIKFSGGTYGNVYFTGTTNGIVLDSCDLNGGVRNFVVTGGSVTIRNCTIRQGSNISTYLIAGVYVFENVKYIGASGNTYTAGIRVDSGVTSLTIDGLEISGWSLANVYNYVIYLNACSGVSLSDVTVSGNTHGIGLYAKAVAGLEIDGLTVAGQPNPGVVFDGCTYLDLTRVDVSGCTGAASYGVQFLSSSGAISDSDSSGNSAHGFYLSGTSNITATRCIAEDNGLSAGMDGFWAQDSSVLNAVDCVASGSYKDGFSANGAAHITCTRCFSEGNGVRDASDNLGNGFTGHGTSVTVLKSCVATNNTKSGCGYIDTSSVSVLGCTLVGNDRPDKTSHFGELYVGGSAVMTVKNTIAKSLIGKCFLIATDATQTLVVSNNEYMSSIENPFHLANGDDVGFADWAVATSDTHSVYADPLLDAELHIPTNSIAFGSGAVLAELSGLESYGGDVYDTVAPSIGACENLSDGIRGQWTPFDSTLPALSLASTCPGSLLEVQEWSKPVTKKQIDGVR